MEGKDREGLVGSGEIEFQQDSIPKKFQDRQREAARDGTASWMFPEQTTGSTACVQASQGVSVAEPDCQ